MSIAPAAARPPAGGPPRAGEGEAPRVRRVRHQARDAATVMAFSALASTGVAAAFLLLTVLIRQG